MSDSSFALAPERFVERDLHVLLIGQELRVEFLASFLNAQRGIKVVAQLSDITMIEPMIALAERLQNDDVPIDVAVLDFEGDFAVTRMLVRALATIKQRCVIVASLLPSEIDELRQVGAWGHVSTHFSAQHVLTTIWRVAQGIESFPTISAANFPLTLARVRQLVLNRERLDAFAAEQEPPWEFTMTDIRILEHFSVGDSRVLAEKLNRTQGTIRTRLHQIYRFLQRLSGQDVSDRLTALQILLRFGILVYR
jgi:DNA-binding NarL/FixJ family response regulator